MSDNEITEYYIEVDHCDSFNVYDTITANVNGKNKDYIVTKIVHKDCKTKVFIEEINILNAK